MAAAKKLNIVLASAEVAPLAKTGGLADVASALPAWLHDAGHDVRLLMPRYAMLERQDLKIHKVRQLQDLVLRAGTREIRYAIDTTILPGTSLPVLLLRCPELYGRDSIYTEDADEHLRFILLSRAALEMCRQMHFAPDIVHCHDWHTALIPLYLRARYGSDALFRKARSVMTIHNIGYQGVFGAGILDELGLGGAAGLLHQDDLKAGQINFLKTGLLHADLITTVSPTYAQEIQGPEYGAGLDGLLRQRADSVIGILNGVDYAEWNPATDALIAANYTADDLSGKRTCKRALMKALELTAGGEQPLVGIVSRLVGQKGFELVANVLPGLMLERDFSLAVLGSGESRYERLFSRLQEVFPDRVHFSKGYNNELAHQIEAGADLFLMPSRYEPCGLNQMYSLKYGTVPIVRKTGGLADSVQAVDAQSASGTGIVFEHYDDSGLRWALRTALDLYSNAPVFRQIMLNGMAEDFSWASQGALYEALFRRQLE
ncbi:MAG: glycogen synthase GlgA [Gammaproteobacteria bacterium]|nr:glycogen synthase GlgA [Gammaproteobacteria bacterium]MDH5303709.1 glycogen synthase GlgA [Gammaproteobacteria bacterium]MDH5322709.1 glycogen synthase GlgA [Gammaproteobacteria bacterium]